MGGKVVEKAIVIGTLSIFEAFELNVSGLLLFSVVDFFARVSNIIGIDRIENEKLKSPDDIGCIFNVS